MDEKSPNLQIIYTPRGRLLELHLNGETIKLSMVNLVHVYNLINKGIFEDILLNEKIETNLNIPYYEDTPLEFLNLFESKKPKKSRESSSPFQKYILWKHYHQDSKEGNCYTCGKKILSDEVWHLSHVIAVSKGGSSELENLRICCPKCNLRMGNQNLYTFVHQNPQNMNGLAKNNKDDYFVKYPDQKNDKRGKYTNQNTLSKEITKEFLVECPIGYLRELLIEKNNSGIIWEMNKQELVDNLYSALNNNEEIKIVDESFEWISIDFKHEFSNNGSDDILDKILSKENVDLALNVELDLSDINFDLFHTSCEEKEIISLSISELAPTLGYLISKKPYVPEAHQIMDELYENYILINEWNFNNINYKSKNFLVIKDYWDKFPEKRCCLRCEVKDERINFDENHPFCGICLAFINNNGYEEKIIKRPTDSKRKKELECVERLFHSFNSSWDTGFPCNKCKRTFCTPEENEPYKQFWSLGIP